MADGLVPMPTWRALLKEYKSGRPAQQRLIDAWLHVKVSRARAFAKAGEDERELALAGYKFWADLVAALDDIAVNRDRDKREFYEAVKQLAETLAEGADERRGMLEAEQEAEYARRFLTEPDE